MDRRGRICVAIGAENAAAAAAAVRPVESLVDVVEIRLDGMREPGVQACCSLIHRPLLFTNRPTWEGGQCRADDGERALLLHEAIEAGASFIDFELQADRPVRDHLLNALQGTDCRMILSCHDFSATPSPETLESILHRMAASGAHIGKIITTAREPLDVLRVLALQEQSAALDFPLIAFCMGEAGRISRLSTLFLGGFMTYAAVDERQATAPGQFSVRRLHELLSLFETEHHAH